MWSDVTIKDKALVMRFAEGMKQMQCCPNYPEYVDRTFERVLKFLTKSCPTRFFHYEDNETEFFLLFKFSDLLKKWRWVAFVVKTTNKIEAGKILAKKFKAFLEEVGCDEFYANKPIFGDSVAEDFINYFFYKHSDSQLNYVGKGFTRYDIPITGFKNVE